MLPLTIIHDSDVLRYPYALISLAACRNSHIPCNTNATSSQIIGCSDHLLEELPILLEFLRQGRIDLSHVITESVSLDADAINDVLDKLEQFKGHVRSVIKPTQ